MFSITARLRDVLTFAPKRRQRASQAIADEGTPHPPHRTLSDPAGRQLQQWILKTVPRDKGILVMAIRGNVESCLFALEIQAFLRANGFRLEEPEDIWQAEPDPVPTGVKLRSESDGLCVLVVGTNDATGA